MLGRTSGGFCDVDLHLLMFFIHIFFSTSSLTVPWAIARFLDPFCTFSSPYRRVIRDTFIFNHFVIFLPRVLRFWAVVFYPQSFFSLNSFPTFWHNLLLSRFHWEPAATFLKVAGLQTDSRNIDPAHLFVWVTVIHNLLYI